jgi:hypothetical protein
MSDSELSDVPEDLDDYIINEDNSNASVFSSSSLSLPSLPQSSNDGVFSSSSLSLPQSSTVILQLLVTHSTLFTKNLYSRTIIRGSPNKIQYAYTQENCSYTPEAKLVSQNTTSNLWRHIELKHLAIFKASSKSTRKPQDKDDISL